MAILVLLETHVLATLATAEFLMKRTSLRERKCEWEGRKNLRSQWI